MKYLVKKIVALLGVLSIGGVLLLPMETQASFSETEGTVQVQGDDQTANSDDGYSFGTDRKSVV